MRRPPDSASSASALTPFSSVEECVHQSTELWARDLRSLFEHAVDRFADVSWETDSGDRIWAHKAVVYVRAPKAFKDRYFLSNKTISSRPPTSFSHHSTSPYPVPSLLSATSARNSPSPSFFRGSSTSVDTAESDGTLRAPTLNAGGDGSLHLGSEDSPELLRSQLEWLYTGEGFGDVVEWISEDEGAPNGHKANGGSVRDSLGRRGNLADRRDKLGQDLTYMWTSKLYCDVRIHLETPEGEEYYSDDSDASEDSLAATVIFTAHRFMLASRSPYFSSLLLNPTEFRPATADIYLPTPPFSPASLHFCLGWIYAGHLDFSNRSFDLQTAFQIYRSANYLQLDALTSEIESRLVYDFCHGLDWARCHCRKCISRIPRVWKFSCAPDVGAVDLQRRARRFILTGWSECWNRDVGLADPKEREGLMNDVVSVLSPNNIIVAFRSIGRVRTRMEHGIRAKGRDAASWVDALGVMVDAVEKRSRDIMATHFGIVAESTDLWDLINGKGFNGDVFDVVMREIVDVSGRAPFTQAPKMYQSIVSSLLLKVDPDTLETALPARSVARQKIETAKDGVLAHIRRRWMQIKEDGGFGGLEPWALKEISDEIEVSLDDLTSPRQVFPGAKATRRPVSSTNKAARTSRTSDSSHASTVRSPLDSDQPEPNGLRRLRLSSSASTSSARSSTSRPPSRPTVSTAGASARSPTAAGKTPVVSVGSKRPTRPGASSPTPTRPGQVMSGPPRPLLTGKTAAPKVRPTQTTSTAPQAGPSVRHQKSTPALRSQPSNQTLRHQPSLASVKSTASSGRASATPRAVKSTASLRSAAAAARAKPGSTSSTATRGSTTSASTRVGSEVAPKAVVKAASPITTVRPGTSASVTRPGTSLATRPIVRPRTTSMVVKPTKEPAPVSRPPGMTPSKSSTALRARTVSATSVKSKSSVSSMAPSLSPSVTSSKSSSVKPVPRAPTKPTPAPTSRVVSATKPAPKPEIKPTLRTSASNKSLSRVAASPKVVPPLPKTPTAKTPRTSLNKTPSTPSDTLQTPSTGASQRVRSTSLNPRATPPSASASRQRTASGATPPWKRATPVPTSVAGVRQQPRKSMRSSSGSTEGPHEAITPRMSGVVEPIIVDATAVSPVVVSPDPKKYDVEESVHMGPVVELVEPETQSEVEPERPTELETERPKDEPVEVKVEPPPKVKSNLSDSLAGTAPESDSEPTTPTKTASTPMDLTPKPAPSTPPDSLQAASMEATPTATRTTTPSVVPTLVTPTSQPKASTLRTAPIAIPPPSSYTSWTAPPPRLSSSVPETPPMKSVAVFGSPVALTSSPPMDGSPQSATSLAGSPLSTIARGMSDGGTSRSLTSPSYRPHPAHAFDPPPRKPTLPAPPKIEITDDNVAFDGRGVALHVGIPCIVTLSQRRARFRANVKYLGRMADTRGAWVGLEVDDLERFGVETLPTGAKGGIRYFHFTKPATNSTDADARTRRQRRIATIAESLPPRRRFNGLGLAGLDRRAVSPFVSDWAAPENPRALFVRPSEIVFVMGAE